MLAARRDAFSHVHHTPAHEPAEHGPACLFGGLDLKRAVERTVSSRLFARQVFTLMPKDGSWYINIQK